VKTQNTKNHVQTDISPTLFQELFPDSHSAIPRLSFIEILNYFMIAFQSFEKSRFEN